MTTPAALERRLAALEAAQPKDGIDWAAMPDDLRTALAAYRAERRAWFAAYEARHGPGAGYAALMRNPRSGPQMSPALAAWLGQWDTTPEITRDMSVVEIQRIAARAAGIVK